MYSRPSPPAPAPSISKKITPSPPPTPTTRTLSPSVLQQQQQQSYGSIPVRNGTASPVTVRNGQMSPITTPTMLQSQLDKMHQRKEEDRRKVPSRNQVEQQVPMTPSFDRRNSYSASDNIKSRLVSKIKTPTFGELQYRFGKEAKSPSPVLDKDYQKEARQTVVGELSRYDVLMFLLEKTF